VPEIFATLMLAPSSRALRKLTARRFDWRKYLSLKPIPSASSPRRPHSRKSTFSPRRLFRVEFDDAPFTQQEIHRVIGNPQFGAGGMCGVHGTSSGLFGSFGLSGFWLNETNHEPNKQDKPNKLNNGLFMPGKS
jgi:hypothetical protein